MLSSRPWDELWKFYQIGEIVEDTFINYLKREWIVIFMMSFFSSNIWSSKGKKLSPSWIIQHNNLYKPHPFKDWNTPSFSLKQLSIHFNRFKARLPRRRVNPNQIISLHQSCRWFHFLEGTAAAHSQRSLVLPRCFATGGRAPDVALLYRDAMESGFQGPPLQGRREWWWLQIFLLVGRGNGIAILSYNMTQKYY